ncbi:60S acidic ribosomal protein P2-4-like [Argentina anserina]|uniref:60S acidic ribosomal protein P2-4-like n=1 Tax=Argentina anserina TaxID=57926 RepID=UPI002176902F|nr:60S acidic ribosomal protein P2-4-like [Potentilla anserina]
MKVIAAYMLAQLGGKANPSADDLKRIIGSVGAEVDGDRIELFLSRVSGKSIAELVASGRQKMASVPSSGDASAAALTSVAEETKEEKAEEEEEEDDDFDEPLLDLFGPDN